jgi:hypothetical protein
MDTDTDVDTIHSKSKLLLENIIIDVFASMDQ